MSAEPLPLVFDLEDPYMRAAVHVAAAELGLEVLQGPGRVFTVVVREAMEAYRLGLEAGEVVRALGAS